MRNNDTIIKGFLLQNKKGLITIVQSLTFGVQVSKSLKTSYSDVGNYQQVGGQVVM